MSRPTNSIAKVQLPGENEQRPIIPYAIGKSADNNYQATIEENLTADRYLQLKPERKKFSDTIGTTGRHYFGEIVPTYSAQRPWHATYEIEFWKKNTTYNAPSFSAIVTVSSTAAAIGGQEGCTIIAINNIGANATTSQPWSSGTLFDLHSVYTITPSGLSNSYGHLIGYNTMYDVNTNFYCYVRVIEAEGCQVNLFNSAVTAQNSSQSSYLATEYTCATTMGFQTYPAIQSGVNVQNSTSIVYLTGTTSSGTGSASTLYKNNSVYLSGDTLHAFSVEVVDEDHSYEDGYTRYNGSYIYRYWYNPDENIGYEYNIALPEESGTIALEPNWHYFSLTSNNNNNKNMMFGEIIPSDVTRKAWSVTYEIRIEKISSDSTQYYPQYAKVTVSSTWSSNYNNGVSISAINSNGSSSSNGGLWIAENHVVNTITKAGLDNGYGHMLGFYVYQATKEYQVWVRVLSATNCSINWYNNLYQDTTRPAYSYRFNSNSCTFITAGLQAASINDAATQVSTHANMYNNNNYYLTASVNTNSNKSALWTNPNVYIRNNALYSPRYYSNGAKWEGNFFYDSNSNAIELPHTNGQLALKSDINNITIEDLTSL